MFHESTCLCPSSTLLNLLLKLFFFFTNAERTPSPNSSTGSKRSTLRWKKDYTFWRSASEVGDEPRVDIKLDASIEGNLSTQTSPLMMVLLKQITFYMPMATSS